MQNLAIRHDGLARVEGAVSDAWSWLPPEAPLAMPRQSLNEGTTVKITSDTAPAEIARRRLLVFGSAAVLTLVASLAPLSVYLRDMVYGVDGLETFAFAVFFVLISAIACWFCSGVAGLTVLLRGREQDDIAFAPAPPTPATRTAVLMPLYNEDARASFNRLAAIDASLARLGASAAFDLFVLSDSNKADAVLTERLIFQSFRMRASSAAYYRRRAQNTEHKSGNIADWVRRFGAGYETMIVLDADSAMAGETLLRLVDAMERHPKVGLIQTTPVIIGAETLFARISQFSVRMYGRVAAAGWAWWTGAESSFWGHNAILRVKAFADCCGLPILEGEKPFGGPVMSHDVVEAALLRRAGWAVHVTAALDGSCEETPPTLTDFIRRDHRWCQGNLQHLALIRAKGLSATSRAQLAMGCMAYVSSPLWFASLVAGLVIQLRYPVDFRTWAWIVNPQMTAFTLSAMFCGLLLIGPKLMGALLVLTRPGERRAFGGARRMLNGVAMEITLSAILAPIMMVANTRAIFYILRGHDTGWGAQQRTADGLGWGEAWRAMRWQTVTGLGFCAGLAVRPDLSLVFAPIVLPLLFAAPITVLTSRVSVGRRFEQDGYLITPDDEHALSATPAVLYGPKRRIGFKFKSAV